MRFTAVLVVAVGCSAVFASQPGERLSVEDLVLDVAGLKAEPFLPPLLETACFETSPPHNQVSDPRCFRPYADNPVDAAGSFYYGLASTAQIGLRVSTIWRMRRDGTIEPIARINERQGSGNTYDAAGFSGLYIDLVRGELYVRLVSACAPADDPACNYEPASSIFRIVGLSTLPEVLHDLHPHPHDNNHHAK